MSLLDPDIWSRKLFTGSWVEGARCQDATEPATGEVLGTFALADAEQLGRSMASAAEAQPAWADRPYHERAAILRRASLLLDEHRDEVRTWIQREAGKVRAAAELEMDLALEELWEPAALASRPRGEVLQTSRPGRVSIGRRVPWGVVAVVVPWNFPLNLAMRSVGPALACGNAVVLKPATETVVCSGVVIARILEEAGLPAGVLHMLPGPAEGLFVRPTVLEGVTPDMPAHQEEIFGPVAPIVTFTDDEEAIRLANASPYGLVAAVQSASEPRARRVGLRLKAGMVHVNDQTVNDEVIAPFGGWRDSGAGAFGTLTNLDEFTSWQWLTVHDDQVVP